MEPWKGLPFSYLPPPALSHIARSLVHMCVDIPAHISKLHPYPLPKLPLGHPLGLMHTLTVQFTLRGTELWGRGPCKFRGHVGMLFQSFGDLKFVLEDMHSSVWLSVLGPIDSLCCGDPYDWGRARGLLRASGSSGWCQQLPVGGWDFISDEAKLRGPWCFQNPKLNVWL